VTAVQIHQGLCSLNYVQHGAGLHLSEPTVYGGHFFGTHCSIIGRISHRFQDMENSLFSLPHPCLTPVAFECDDINEIYTPLKSTFNGLEFRR